MADLAIAFSSKNLEGSAIVVVFVVVVEGLLHGVIVSGTLNSVVSSFLIL